MVTKTDFIWMDGRLVPWERANVHVLSHTLHYGFGIFEGIRSYPQDEGGAAVFRLPEHCERLIKTARMVGLTLPWNADFIRRAVVHTLEANRLTDAYIRPLVYLGPGSMDTTSTRSPIHLSIAAWPWGKYLGAEGVKNGIRCCISTITRLGGRSHMVKGKIVGHYVNSILAKDEAYRLGFDEALMMDHEGNVVEGSAENLFIVRDGALITPPLDSDILGGI
ncbi:MAG: branched-chain amino acid aminotransferase, partial [Myxococcota bacterium]